jgi:hypothetical protein
MMSLLDLGEVHPLESTVLLSEDLPKSCLQQIEEN